MLLDTSGLLCYLDGTDTRHQKAAALFDISPTLFTHSYVLAEFVPLCQVRGLNRKISLEFVTRLMRNALVEIVWADEKLHREAMNLLHARMDKTYSLCDAVSFILMRERGIADALTTDKHFEQEGFVRLLVP